MAICFVIGKIYFNHEGCPTYYHTYKNVTLNTRSVYAVILDNVYLVYWIVGSFSLKTYCVKNKNAHSINKLSECTTIFIFQK